MKESLARRLGMQRSSDYVERFYTRSNMLSAIYMSGICVALEIWMILSLLTSYFEGMALGKERNLMWLVKHGWWYVLLLSVALIMFFYSLRFWQGKVRNERIANGLLWVFSIVCIAFGIHYGVNSYSGGEQVLAFVTMSLFVFGMIAWKPIFAVVGATLSFGIFYALLAQVTDIPMTYGTQVNLFTLWISTCVVALSLHHQRVAQGMFDENLQEANMRLRYVATHDELTGVGSMHAFRGAVTMALENAQSRGEKLALLFIDIENFKSYNHRYGFAAGDEFLRDIAQGFHNEVFPEEIVARASDDHFVAYCAPERVADAVGGCCYVVRERRGEIRLHTRVGVYICDDPDQSIDQALNCARIAANSIKLHPGEHLRYYDEQFKKSSELRQYVINNVERAAKEGWIRVFYQPVVDCKGGTGKLVGREALARWDDPTHGLLPPYAFIETLEQQREIDILDRCIIEQVCRDLREDLDAGREVVPVSLNFSRLDFELYNVPAFLKQMSEKYDVPANLLDVEITESALTDQFDELQANMARLREGGFALWLDDFGSGYSSLNVLKDFDFDVLKIDMVFLRRFEGNQDARVILNAIVELAHSLGMVTLCEGVETQEQFDFLHGIGCDKAQGYYFGKPAPRAA